MSEEIEFMEELLLEAEQQEQKLTAAYFDLVIMDIIKLQRAIAGIISESDKEVEIIKSWSLNKCSKLQDKIEFYTRKLEAFIREEKKKTVDLPHGILKIRQNPDSVEILDLDTFLINATPEMLSVIPESLRPSIQGIKNFIKNSGRIPEGVRIIPGKESFKLNIKQQTEEI